MDALLGSQYADAMWWRFCAAESWRVVADRVGLSERWCQDACEASMDQVDAYGIRAMLDGLWSAAE